MATVLTNLGTQVGEQATSGNGSLAASPSVTAGSSLLVGINAYRVGSATAGASFSKTGTATIGTPVLDLGPIRLLSFGVNAGTYLYRIPVTGSGSLTLSFTSANTLVTWNFIEVSGLAASPLDVTGSNSAGSGTSLSTGSVSATTSGIAFGCFLDGGASSQTFSGPNGTDVMNFGNVSLLKGYSEYLVYGSAGSKSLTVSMSNSAEWQGAIVTYKDASASFGRLVGGTLCGGLLTGGLLTS